jgi:lipoic acid synthetase
MRLPEWIKVKHSGSTLHAMKSRLRGHGLSTVCEEARCPNRGECFLKPTATFMILGDRCTRNCGFCSVMSGTPLPVSEDEPQRVSAASLEMGLKYVVITSVTRDDLNDGGAGHFAKTITALKNEIPGIKVEVLTPDFNGRVDSLKAVLEAGPDVFNHNIETVPRLYPLVRPQADYKRSLKLLYDAKRFYPDIKTKSGIMLGLGEQRDEVMDSLMDLRAMGCDFLTIGQYLRPGKENLPVREYVHPGEFKRLENVALRMGFKYAASSPLVRSSMNAEEMFSYK